MLAGLIYSGNMVIITSFSLELVSAPSHYINTDLLKQKVGVIIFMLYFLKCVSECMQNDGGFVSYVRVD